MSGPELKVGPGVWESRAFFAALLAASRGEDTKAADILREIAKSMETEFLKKGVKRGERRRKT